MPPLLRLLQGKLLLALAALTVLPAVSARAADEPPAVVVLASTAPGFAAGQLLGRAPLTVPDGASVTFLLASGQTVTVKGPYAGALANLAPKGGRGLADLFAGGPDRSEIGGTRSLAGTDAELTIDPAAGGIWCREPEGGLRLVRPADPTFDRMELREASSGRAVQLAWDQETTEIAWPADLPTESGRLDATSLRTGAERQLQLRTVATAGRSDAARAASLALAGCGRQAAALIERLRGAMVPLDIYLASDRGRYPSYRAGELIELVVQTNHDAFLYCVLRDGKGQVLPLFPPQPARARVNHDAALRLPNAASPFALRAGPGLDGGEVRCIASEHDLADELPELAAANGPVPLTEAAVQALDEAMADPRQGRVVMAQMILRVAN